MYATQCNAVIAFISDTIKNCWTNIAVFKLILFRAGVYAQRSVQIKVYEHRMNIFFYNLNIGYFNNGKCNSK